jgi:uncharacterized protein
MNETPLSLIHRPLLFESLRAIDSRISEYSFANLYLFRRAHDYRVLDGEELYIRGKMRDGTPYVMPARDVRRVSAGVTEDAVRNFRMMFPVPEEWLSAFDSSVYAVSSTDADSDYLHDTAKLSVYASNKLHAQRNLTNQFIRRYGSNAFPLTNDRLPHAREILDAWQRDAGTSSGESDYDACREAIDLYDELVLCGAIYYADSEPAGFIMGEELNASTFALHFAKGVRKFSGIYQYMYQQFATVMPSRYTALNFEQDLGIEGLRRAKSSYHPETMIRKYRVTLR